MGSSAVRYGIPLIAAALLGGCGASEPEAAVASETEVLRAEGAGPDTLGLPRAELERARRTADALGQDLAGMVFSTMEAEGAAAAVRVCSEVAQERTEEHGGEGVYVRRVSDRLRNPLNEPDPAERRELERMRQLDAQGELTGEIVRVVERGGDRSLHLMRPIRIQPGCLACHGEPAAIPPDVRQILADRYPDDRATGYATGDLRGAVSVRVPLSAAN
jgi:hypothetical protein